MADKLSVGCGGKQSGNGAAQRSLTMLFITLMALSFAASAAGLARVGGR